MLKITFKLINNKYYSSAIKTKICYITVVIKRLQQNLLR